VRAEHDYTNEQQMSTAENRWHFLTGFEHSPN